MNARIRAGWLYAGILLVAACDSGEAGPVVQGAPKGGVTPYPGAPQGVELVTGQSIFVPAYSEVYARGGNRLQLTTSLAIHNTDPSGVLVVESVRHHDTDGELVKDYVEQPIQLAPLATKVFLVEPTASGGGFGANFIVEWASEEAILEPVVEAVMVGSMGTQGFTLLSTGRVFEQDR
jgi:hypothetical protein